MRIKLNHGRLLELIQKSRISQNHWAMRLGLSRGHWSNIVQGKHPYPSGKTRERILETFDVPFDQLFAYEATSGAQASFQAALSDRYLIDREIGQGGMGTVYLARDVRLARQVAVKVVSEEAVSGIGTQQFLREIRYTARLRHHHILPLYDAGEAGGFPYYVMPYLDDGSLRGMLQPGRPLSMDESLPIIRGIAAALQYAHDRHVLHCDVKPENILVSEGHAYVADFGIARAIHAETREWGRRGEIDSSAGTPAYVSPEQAAGEMQLDSRSDTYSLACVVFEMLSGRAPFEGTRTMEVVSRRFVESPSLLDLAPQVPAAVAESVRRGMSVKREDRFESVSAFSDQIAEAASMSPSSKSQRVQLFARRIIGTTRHRLRSKTTQRVTRTMDQIVMDVRYALRTLRRSPLLTFVTVVTLALGIGANTAIFSAVNGILLEGLPFPNSDRVMVIAEVDATGERLQVSPPNFRDWHEASRTFTSLSFSQFYGWQTVVGATEPVRAIVERVGRDFFDVFDVSPSLGRTFLETETTSGGDAVVVVSHAFWRNYLGATADLSSRALQVLGETYQVVGVMPPDFRFQAEPDLWIPAERQPMAPSRTTFSLRVIGRLAPGQTAATAQNELVRIQANIRTQDPRASPSVFMHSLQDDIVGNTRRPLYLLTGAAILLLLIACTNVASTLLARGEKRHRELAMRAALGARRGRVIRQLLTESIVLAGVAMIAGIAVAAILVRTFTALASSSLTRVENIQLDLSVMGYAAGVMILTTVLVGLWPAIRGTKHSATTVLRGSGASTGRKQRVAWSALVTAEITVAFVLVVGAAQLITSFWNVVNVDAGFDPTGLLTVEYALPESKYETDALPAFHRQFLEAVSSMPGVSAVGLVNHVPLGRASMFAGVRRIDSDEWGRGDYRLASPGYFKAMGTPVLAGREFMESDVPGAVHAVVVNQRLAAELFPDEDPIGKQIMIGGNDLQYETPLEIVGVVPAVRHRRLTALEPPTYYVNYVQRPTQGQKVVAAIRTSGDPRSLVAPIQDRLRQMDRDVPAEFLTMTSRVSESVANERFTVVVLAAFTLVALGLAMVGIFGVVSYTVAQRTREIGIRLALGAIASEVRNLILRESLVTILSGATLGTMAALYLGRVMRGILFEVNAFNPVFLGLATLLLGATALLATWIPARRGVRVDPTIAIRTE